MLWGQSFLVRVGSRVSLSLESSLGVSLHWPEWPPGLIVPWQVALRVSLYCAGVLRIGPCSPTPTPWPVVPGLVTGLPSAFGCTWYSVPLDPRGNLLKPRSGQAAVDLEQSGDLAGCERAKGTRELLPHRRDPAAPPSS